ncbi:uncharacterized protein LOC121320404 [Polyodon spathula]|uniref:uncharacterized protein LOC121320404 n=1 Tax=Polyodon spathula TaxID=7913 RepID=UPI001B7DE4F4|nr:uncharacterized protein LOC121320404 [Polyodon spathula]
MSFFICLLLGVFLNTVVSENSKRILIQKNVTGLLGKEAILQCEYTGMEEVSYSNWFIKKNGAKEKVAGYTAKSYVKNQRFSSPQSNKNLTVKINRTQLEDEKIYICAFSTDSQELEETLYLTVLVPPDVYISSSAQTENEDEHQSIECAAFNSKPAANISWVVSGLIAESIKQTTNKHLNGTLTQKSVYRFPTYLHEGKDITCMVDHPAFTEVKTMMIQVPSYTVPNTTVQIYTTNENETEYKTIECTAAKGKPAAKITWVLPENKSGEINYGITADNGTKTVTSTYRFPTHLHEGQNITCVIEHPKLSIKEVKTVSLPAYYLSSMHVRDGETVNKPNPIENEVMYRVVLNLGQRNQTIVIEVEGNVPHYTLKCIKQNNSLPLDIKMVKNGMFFEGPIKESHSGIFICIASYYGHQLSVPVEIQVCSEKPVPPNISTLVFDEAEHKVIRCIAANSKPAARITWHLPGNLTGDVMYNSAFENGTHTVTGAVSFPADLPEEHNITCVIEHPAFEAPETRIIHILTSLVPPNISFMVLDEAEQKVIQCIAANSKPAAKITWNLPRNLPKEIMYNSTFQNGTYTAISAFSLFAYLPEEHNVSCVIEHPALHDPETRTIHIPPCYPNIIIKSFLATPKNTQNRLAVCQSIGNPTGKILWVLPKNNTGNITYKYENGTGTLTSIYEFPFALHEGQNITCVINYGERLAAEKRIIHIPQYYISSIKVLHESQLNGKIILHRGRQNQTIVLKVNGNVPLYHLECRRMHGLSPVKLLGNAIFFEGPFKESQSGIYICEASFYHHRASAQIDIRITSEDRSWEYILVCFSAAAGLMIIATVFIYIIIKVCKEPSQDHPKSKNSSCNNSGDSMEHLTHILLEQKSPALQNMHRKEKQEEYTIHYSVVIDLKTYV